ncbi:MAG: beta-ketoacyl synthase chain length factor, partial [Pseudohongiellaceae bacterium]
MSRYHLNIVRWSALSATRAQQGDWVAWAQGGRADEPDAPVKVDLPQVPAMLRRRLTAMGKRALWCAYQVLDPDVRPIATVFSSQHGEVEQTLKLLTDLASGQSLSPTGFSLSVHNAIGGIYSMAGKETGFIT